MQEQSRHWADGHGDVVGQSVVSQSFTSSGGGHDVDDNGVSAHRYHSEREAMNDAAQDEDGKCPCQHISAEHHCKEKIG